MAGPHSPVAGWSAALIRRAARRIGGQLLDGVESSNHAREPTRPPAR
jgi:hypothetical protein